MRLPLAIIVALLPVLARAEAPKTVADIAPVHSIVAAIMEGAGAPGLLLPADASPHHYALRPSEARMLAQARLLVSVGPALTPWLEDAAARIAPDLHRTALLETALEAAGPAPGGGRKLARPARGEDHDEDHAEARHDDEGHAHEDDHHEDGRHEEDHHEDGHHGDDHHGEGEDGARAHDHGGVDPHAWLDPRAAAAWTGPIAAALSDADPANAALYAANAARLRAELAALEAELDAALAPVRGRPYVVYHDAFGWFERRFGLTRLGAAAQQDGARPAPARVAQLRAALAGATDPCVFAEPQQSDRLLRALAESGAVRIGRIDPLGAGLTPGPGLYPQLLRNVAAALRSCLMR